MASPTGAEMADRPISSLCTRLAYVPGLPCYIEQIATLCWGLVREVACTRFSDL